MVDHRGKGNVNQRRTRKDLLMAESRDMRKQIEHLVERSQREIVEASRNLARGITKGTDRVVTPISNDIERIVDDVSDFAERVVNSQRRMVRDVVKAINEQADRAVDAGRTTTQRITKRAPAKKATAKKAPAKKATAKRRQRRRQWRRRQWRRRRRYPPGRSSSDSHGPRRCDRASWRYRPQLHHFTSILPPALSTVTISARSLSGTSGPKTAFTFEMMKPFDWPLQVSESLPSFLLASDFMFPSIASSSRSNADVSKSISNPRFALFFTSEAEGTPTAWPFIGSKVKTGDGHSDRCCPCLVSLLGVGKLRSDGH